MDAYGIADIYKAAKIPLSPEQLKLRQEPFDAIRAKLTLAQAVDLTRLYFGAKEPVGEWFFTAFHGGDNTFSMHDNAREAAVLAASILAAAVQGKKQTMGLAPLAAGFAGVRKPLVVPELRALFEKRLAEASITEEPGNIKISAIKAPALGKAGADAQGLAQAGDWARAAALLKQVADESHATAAAVGEGAAEAIKVLMDETAALREETNMLWWYVGGVSRKSNDQFAGMEAGTAAIMAGIDLSDLSNTLAGPYSGPALLQRLLQAGRKGKLPAVTLQEAIEGVPVADVADIMSHARLPEMPETLPVLSAIRKFQESGAGVWAAGFKKVSGLAADQKIAPLDLAVQSYRERQLLAGLS